MTVSGGPLTQRQIRRVEMPLGMLVAFLDRQSDLLNSPRLHTAQADARHGKLILYIESTSSHPVPMDLDLNWEEIFGTIPCASCGTPTTVENITVCKNCATPK